MKNSIKFFVVSLLFLIFNSCSTETRQDCEINKYGTVQITNTSSNPYDIYIDGKFVLKLFGNQTSSKLKVSEGNDRKFYAEQASGFVLFPTVKNSTLSIISCSSYTWQIP